MAAYSEVFVWGADHFGQLGLGKKDRGKCYSLPRCCTFNVRIKQVACGEEHAAFIALSGSLYCMGSNAAGRLGIGDLNLTTQCSSPCLVEGLSRYKCVDVSCGWGHTVAVTEDGSVFSWGVGDYGALGTGTTDSHWVPTQVRVPKVARQVSCGSRHTALLVGHTSLELFTWGAGEAGQLGTGHRERELFPVSVRTEALKQVACGVFHTLLLTEGGSVFAMGGNTFGQLGSGNKKSSSLPARVRGLESLRIKKVCASTQSAALTEDGDLYVWGASALGEFLLPHHFTHFSSPLKDISLGGSFAAAIDLRFNVWTWGYNNNGELGLGDFESQTSPTPVVALEGKTLKSVSCGGSFVIAIGSDVFDRTPSRAPSPANRALMSSQRQPSLRSRSPIDFEVPERLSERLALPRTPKRPLSRLDKLDSSERFTVKRPLETEELTLALEQAMRREDDLRRDVSLITDEKLALQVLLNRQRRQAEKLKEEARESTYLEERLSELEALSTADRQQLTTVQRQLTETQRQKDYADREVLRLNSQNSDLHQRILEWEAKTEDSKRYASQAEESLRLELERTKSALARTEESQRDWEEQAEQAKTEQRRSTQERLAASRRVTEVEKDLKLRSSEMTSLLIENERLKSSIEAMEADFSRTQHREREAELRIQTEVSRQVADVRSELEEEVSQLEAKLSKLNQDLETQKYARKTAEQELERKAQALGDLQSAYSEQNLKFNRATRSYYDREEELEGSIEAARAEKNTAEERLKSLGVQCTALQSELTGMKSSVRRTAELERDLEAARRDLWTKEESQAQLARELEAFKRDSAQQREILDDLRKMTEDEMNSQSSAAKRQLQSQRDKYEGRLIELERIAKEAEDEVERGRKELENEQSLRQIIEDKLSDLRRKYQDVNLDTEDSRQQLNTMMADLTDLRDELAQAQRSWRKEASARADAERVSQQFNDKNAELLRELELKSSAFETQRRDLESYKLQCENLRYAHSESQEELDRLHLQLEEHLTTVDRLTRLLDEWENKYRQLAEENIATREELAEVEAKNRNLFESLERSLTQKARDYKEKTESLLNTPMHTARFDERTPGRGQPSPYQDRLDILPNTRVSKALDQYKANSPERSPSKYPRGGNAAEDMLEVIHAESPLHSQRSRGERTPGRHRSPLPTESNSARTPSKLDDIKARLASLHSSKSELESKMRDFASKLGTREGH
jgi:alpha-tubulin suppressor-like RCC1 family protein